MSDSTSEQLRPVFSGQDRFERHSAMIWGLLPLSIKLSGQDTGGQMLIFEHRDIQGGGPPRHVHHNEDEWFYVIKGRFAFELDGKQLVLATGDTFFAPRGIPHGWCQTGDEPGTLLTIISPVGRFEEFIIETTRHATVPSPEELDRAFADGGMRVTGPPMNPQDVRESLSTPAA